MRPKTPRSRDEVEPHDFCSGGETHYPSQKSCMHSIPMQLTPSCQKLKGDLRLVALRESATEECTDLGIVRAAGQIGETAKGNERDLIGVGDVSKSRRFHVDDLGLNRFEQISPVAGIGEEHRQRNASASDANLRCGR